MRASCRRAGSHESLARRISSGRRAEIGSSVRRIRRINRRLESGGISRCSLRAAAWGNEPEESVRKRTEDFVEQVTMLLRREILRLSPPLRGQRRHYGGVLLLQRPRHEMLPRGLSHSGLQTRDDVSPILARARRGLADYRGS